MWFDRDESERFVGYEIILLKLSNLRMFYGNDGAVEVLVVERIGVNGWRCLSADGVRGMDCEWSQRYELWMGPEVRTVDGARSMDCRRSQNRGLWMEPEVWTVNFERFSIKRSLPKHAILGPYRSTHFWASVGVRLRTSLTPIAEHTSFIKKTCINKTFICRTTFCTLHCSDFLKKLFDFCSLFCSLHFKFTVEKLIVHNQHPNYVTAATNFTLFIFSCRTLSESRKRASKQLQIC